MLTLLHIENIAVVERADIEPGPGLNILTGETGTGKSIIIDSINIILGERISRKIIRTGTEKAYVEALFQINSNEINNILLKNGIQPEEDNTILISKEITTKSRSTCRINGHIVTLSMLRKIGSLIVNIHGQHDNQDLLQIDKHIIFLDKYGGDEVLSTKSQYTEVYMQVLNLKEKINKINYNEREKERTKDLLKFQLNEIKDAYLKVNEEEELNKSKNILINSEKILKTVSDAYDYIYSGSQKGISIYDMISEVLNNFNDVKHLDTILEGYFDKIENISYELNDIANEIRNYRDGFEYNPELINTIEERLDLIFKLKRKYGSSIKEILQYADEVEIQLNDLLNASENIKELKEKLALKTVELEKLANKLYKNRIKAGLELEKKVIDQLKDLDMDKINFKVKIEQRYGPEKDYLYTKTGYDKVEFLISTNPGEPLKPLSEIASGGEMSRIILAIKTIIADIDDVNTLIFDEIDIGVSGRAAQKIAEKLSTIAIKKQVLCITHLPQIASMADNHYLIEKETINNKTTTSVIRLDDKEREKELARIIGGIKITELTLKHAEEMIILAKATKKSLKV